MGVEEGPGPGAGVGAQNRVLHSIFPGWSSEGTARAIGLALCRAQGQSEAGIRSVEYCLGQERVA